jgi:hypothetical protein
MFLIVHCLVFGSWLLVVVGGCLLIMDCPILLFLMAYWLFPVCSFLLAMDLLA